MDRSIDTDFSFMFKFAQYHFIPFLPSIVKLNLADFVRKFQKSTGILRFFVKISSWKIRNCSK